MLSIRTAFFGRNIVKKAFFSKYFGSKIRNSCKSYQLSCVINIWSFNLNKYSLKIIILGKRETTFEYTAKNKFPFREVKTFQNENHRTRRFKTPRNAMSKQVSEMRPFTLPKREVFNCNTFL